MQCICNILYTTHCSTRVYPLPIYYTLHTLHSTLQCKHICNSVCTVYTLSNMCNILYNTLHSVHTLHSTLLNKNICNVLCTTHPSLNTAHPLPIYYPSLKTALHPSQCVQHTIHPLTDYMLNAMKCK